MSNHSEWYETLESVDGVKARVTYTSGESADGVLDKNGTLLTDGKGSIGLLGLSPAGHGFKLAPQIKSVVRLTDKDKWYTHLKSVANLGVKVSYEGESAAITLKGDGSAGLIKVLGENAYAKQIIIDTIDKIHGVRMDPVLAKNGDCWVAATKVLIERYSEFDNKLEAEPQFTNGAAAPSDDGIFEDCEHDLWIQLNGASTIIADPDSGWSSPMGVAAELSECKGLPEYYAPYHRVRLML